MIQNVLILFQITTGEIPQNLNVIIQKSYAPPPWMPLRIPLWRAVVGKRSIETIGESWLRHFLPVTP